MCRESLSYTGKQCRDIGLALFDLATVSDGQTALQRHLQDERRHVEQDGSFINLSNAPSGIQSLVFDDPMLSHIETEPSSGAQCLEEPDIVLSLLSILDSCRSKSPHQQACVADLVLRLARTSHHCATVPLSSIFPGLRRRWLEPRAALSSRLPVLVPRTAFENRIAQCVKETVSKPESESSDDDDDDDDDDQDEDAEKVYIHCFHLVTRENIILVVLAVVFFVIGAFSFICVILQVSRRLEDDINPVNVLAAHRSSLQEVNRGTFTNALIPEEEEEDQEAERDPRTGASISKASRVGRWYKRLLKKSRKNTENDLPQRRPVEMKEPPIGRIDKVFVMPPAPNNRAGQKAGSRRTVLRPIDTNLTSGSRQTGLSVGTAHEPSSTGVRRTSGSSHDAGEQ